MQVVHTRCCGLDIHKALIVACVLVVEASGRLTKEVRTPLLPIPGQPLSEKASEGSGRVWLSCACHAHHSEILKTGGMPPQRAFNKPATQSSGMDQKWE